MLKPHEKCWISDDWVYTLFFWSKKAGKAADEELQGCEDEELVQQLDQIYEEKDIEMSFKVPHVMSPDTQWKPKPMQTLKEYCYNIDEKY